MDNIWNKNYLLGRYNRFPFDAVVSFVLRTYGNSSDRKNIKILDLGCGGGNNSIFIASEGFSLYAIDGSRESINLTKKRLDEMGLTNFSLSHCDLASTPYPDNFFDCIIDRQSMGHNSKKDIMAIITEIYRILKPNGRYFGIMFHREDPNKIYGKKLGNGDYKDFKKGTFAKSGLVHFTNTAEIKNLFVKFIIIDIVKIRIQSEILNELSSTQVKIIAKKSKLS